MKAGGIVSNAAIPRDRNCLNPIKGPDSLIFN